MQGLGVWFCSCVGLGRVGVRGRGRSSGVLWLGRVGMRGRGYRVIIIDLDSGNSGDRGRPRRGEGPGL